MFVLPASMNGSRPFSSRSPTLNDSERQVPHIPRKRSLNYLSPLSLAERVSPTLTWRRMT